VKKEASALEGMKQKLKDMDELKRSFLELKHKYKHLEKENDDLQVILKNLS
jgi:acyl carrier protein phosphodiesterase